MKGWVSWFASNHVAANLMMLFIIIAGTVTAFTMKLEIFPDLEMDTITVSVIYTGASPAEVEEGVIRRIEEKVASINGIRNIDSTARENLGIIMLEVEDGFDIQEVLDEVKAEVDRITTLPEESEKPVVRQTVRRSQVISLALYGNVPEATLKRLTEQARESIHRPGRHHRGRDVGHPHRGDPHRGLRGHPAALRPYPGQGGPGRVQRQPGPAGRVGQDQGRRGAGAHQGPALPGPGIPGRAHTHPARRPESDPGARLPP